MQTTHLFDLPESQHGRSFLSDIPCKVTKGRKDQNTQKVTARDGSKSADDKAGGERKVIFLKLL